uniref:Uncharacterized protein n=1 Tax=Lotus japonicus TaxID=34305 RepID=I3SZK5_LOTJA|nr:unknown [Lotus japonicus]
MESAGEWLEKALVELCSKIETGLGLGLDEEIIKGLVSYCNLAEPRDAKEYLDNIIGQEAGKAVIEEYLQKRGYSESSASSNVPTTKLSAYVKPSSADISAIGSKKSNRAPKAVAVRGQDAVPNKNEVNQTPASGSESRASQMGIK